MQPSTFVYENGLPVDYVCRHRRRSSECDDTSHFCREVGESMTDWMRGMSGQSRVRIAKRDQMLDPSMEEPPTYRRLLNE